MIFKNESKLKKDFAHLLRLHRIVFIHYKRDMCQHLIGINRQTEFKVFIIERVIHKGFYDQWKPITHQ